MKNWRNPDPDLKLIWIQISNLFGSRSLSSSTTDPNPFFKISSLSQSTINCCEEKIREKMRKCAKNAGLKNGRRILCSVEQGAPCRPEAKHETASENPFECVHNQERVSVCGAVNIVGGQLFTTCFDFLKLYILLIFWFSKTDFRFENERNSTKNMNKGG